MPAHRLLAASAAMTTLCLVGLAGCAKDPGTTAAGKSASTTAAGPRAPVTAAGGSTGSTPVASGSGGVTVKSFTFKPSPISVRAGETMTWTNEDDILHEPTAGVPGQPSNAFNAVSLDGKGSTGSATIATAGSYPYFCAVHESMVGEITVT